MRLAFLLAASTVLLSQSMDILAEQPDTRAHQHGVARLELFKQVTELQIGFYATGTDILGFEHQPQNQAQADTVKKAIALLSTPDKLFKIEGAECTVTQHQSNLAELQHHSGSKDEHSHEYSHEHEHEHEHEHSGHSDIEASYHFNCTTTGPVTVTVNLFTLFPQLQSINSSWITENGQSAATLSTNESQISLN
ncbi:hypothetical protein WH43_08595 [Rheinheimera sp. KL1]|uniref:ZrgA family zinc uptake protein n=1 Tax=Rheinheimera sp. KL1 TaxID=1635005 RepID=UPI0006A98DF0|nr:DUF2796 domain-containing protein [Rheinheimera sp. KL1]KOO58622.1 hypothetical protein WH43_08595 [Rheinheimera sp. KL1]